MHVVDGGREDRRPAIAGGGVRERERVGGEVVGERWVEFHLCVESGGGGGRR